MKLNDLRVCNLTEPLGFAMEEPVFSWTVEESAGQACAASLRIRAAGETVYDSGETPAAGGGFIQLFNKGGFCLCAVFQI